jgi:hypothetical protein
MSKNLYIVPHDLTEVGSNALRYALHLCKRVEAEIRILHLASSKAAINVASTKIDSIIDQLEIPNGATVTKQVQEFLKILVEFQQKQELS